MRALLRGEVCAEGAHVDTNAMRRPQLLQALLEWPQTVCGDGGDGCCLPLCRGMRPCSTPTATHGEGMG